MRSNLRFVLSLLVLGVLVAFFVPVRDGRPMLTYAGVKERVAGAFRASGTAAGEEGGTLYKWKGPDGSWHYSNVRPADHPEAQVVTGGDVSWVKGSGGAPASDAPASSGGEGEGPRNAQELLAESRRLGEQAEGRESALEKRVREATQD